MEAVLDLYAELYDPNRPVICMDESLIQLVANVQPPLPLQPGRVTRIDHHYERRGTSNLFMFLQPAAGWRHVCVTARRTKIDWAQAMKCLADQCFPETQVIRVVLDNLNTHSPASFYDAFPPDEARRLTERFEFYYTPKHGSWLNMAELEFAVLSKQCLKRRLASQEFLAQEVGNWEHQRNQAQAKVTWRFTTPMARTKLAKLYPTRQN